MSAPKVSALQVSAPANGLSIRAFAEKDGCDEALVRRALRSGRLVALADGKIDPALVGTGWRKSTRRAADSPQVSALSAPKVSAPQVSAPAPADALADIEPPSEEDAQEFIRRVLAGDFATLAEAERIKENALALKHMLDGQRKAGNLISFQVAKDTFFEVARDNRDAWMSWPSRIAVSFAAELGVDARLLTEALNRHVHQHLTELGEPEFDPVLDADGG